MTLHLLLQIKYGIKTVELVSRFETRALTLTGEWRYISKLSDSDPVCNVTAQLGHIIHEDEGHRHGPHGTPRLGGRPHRRPTYREPSVWEQVKSDNNGILARRVAHKIIVWEDPDIFDPEHVSSYIRYCWAV